MKNDKLPVTAAASSAEAFVAQIGFDCGDQEHCFALWVEGRVESGTLCASAEAMHGWLKALAVRFAGRPVAVAVESGSDAVWHAFNAYPWLTLYRLNPVTTARYRQAFAPSGAKDDLPDAHCLLEILRLHREQLRPVSLEDEATRRLDRLVQLRRDAVDRRSQTVTQLVSLLKSYYPQALEWIGVDRAAPLALDFLSRWPDLVSLKAARPGAIQKFYYAHNVRQPELVAQRLEAMRAATCLTTDWAVTSVAVVHLKLLVAVIRTYQKHIAQMDQAIAQAFQEHPEAFLYRELPRAGANLGPRLLVALGTDRTRYPDAASLQKYAGIAPVRERSGSQLWTHWRWRAPQFLRQTFIEWAGQTVVACDWARAYYQTMKQRGKKHHVILRALAFKWIRILWKCWQTRTPYSEAIYNRSLQNRQSPYGIPKTKAA